MKAAAVRTGAVTGLPVALVLAASGGVIWAGHASSLGQAGGILAALGGGMAGHFLAEGRIRAWAATLLTCLMVPLGLVFEQGLVRRWIPPALSGPWVAATGELAGLGLASAGLAALAGFWCRRRHTGAVFPAVGLVVGCALWLRQHRGGAIHLPYALSDAAWIGGAHPALVLAGLGSLAAFVACWGLYRPGSARRAPLHFAFLALLVLVVTHTAPRIGLLELPGADPLHLDQKPEQPRHSSGEGRPGALDTDPLGLATPRGGRGGLDQEVVPFLDEYPTEGNQTPVAVVLLHDDVTPAGGVFYFRQVAFTKWNGRRLVRSWARGVDEDMFAGFPGLQPLETAPPPRSEFRQPVPATVSLIRDHGLPPVMAQGWRIEPLENPDPALFRRSYGTLSEVLTLDSAAWVEKEGGDSSWPAPVRETYLELPGDGRYTTLAAEIRGLLKPEYRDRAWPRALALVFWLEQNTRYSVKSKHAGAPDPTASFLFGDRVGYCVHLAHAAALLARSLGLPARVAAGYAYTDADRGGGSSILLRSGDAHAWAEIFLEGIGWVPLDPSPPSLDPPLAPPSPDLQRLLGEMARPAPRRERSPAGPLAASRSASWLLPFLALAALSWVSAGFAGKLWRRARAAWTRHDPQGRLILRAALDRLGEAGWVRETGETREAFAARLRGRVPAFEELTRLNLAACFGGRRAETAHLRGIGRQVAREVRRQGGLRKVLGWLRPWNWTRSR